MKKQLFLAVLSLGIMAALSGCSGQNGGTGSQQESSDKGEAKNTEDTSAATRLVTVGDVEDYVEIAEYKGLNLEMAIQEVTDEEVQIEVAYDLSKNKVEVADGAQPGDQLKIDYIGMKDGVAFAGGTASNYELVLGEAYMVAGFEDGIVGMKKGETKDISVTLPEAYADAALAGQPVTFQVTVQSVRRTPELTDEWVAAVKGLATVDEYRASVRAQLEEAAKVNAEDILRTKAWEMVVNASDIIEFPEKDIENASVQYKDLIQGYAAQADMEMEEFLVSQGMTMDDYQSQCRQYAELKVKQNLVVQGIMDAEKLSLEDEECIAIQNELVEHYSVKDLAELIDVYGLVSVDETIGLLRVEAFLVENAIVSEEIVSDEAAA